MKKIILKITILLSTMFIGIGVVDAASFTISATKNLSKGTTTKLTIKGSDVTGRFNIKTSNASVVSISEDRVWIENNTYTITLNALSVGTATITVTPSNTSDGSGNSVSLSAKTIKITVSLPREKSTDNTLSSLSIDGFEISPSFNKDTLDYEVNVQEGTTSIKINANATSKYASVTGTGTKDVIEGINNFAIVVKSESGSERIYNLVVNVIDQNPINVEVNGNKYTIIKLRKNYSCKEHFTESELVINNVPIPSCINESINYTLVGLKNEEGVVEDYIYKDGSYIKYNELNSAQIKLVNEAYDGVVDGLTETKIKIDGIDYQAFKLNDDSKYYVLYGMNIENGEKSLYLYDSINKTFSGYDTEYIDFLKNQNQTYLYVIIAFGCGLFLSIICIFILNNSKKKIKKTKVDNNESKTVSKNDKKKEKKIKEEISSSKEDNNIENKVEDNNKIEDISENTKEVEKSAEETYYLFESDRKKKQKKVKK